MKSSNIYHCCKTSTRSPVICVLLLLVFKLSYTVNVSAQKQNLNDQQQFYPNVKECGMTDEIAGDVRTKIPWLVSVYIQKSPGSKFEYFVTGSLLTSTTVITIFGGGYGYPIHKNKRKRYYIPPPSCYLAVAGLGSTGLEDADRFTQYANISYLAPFTGNSTENRDYHLVILRLSTPFKFNTPYVRPICIPFAILPFLKSVGFEGKFSEIITFREEASFLAGFNIPLRQKGPYKSQLIPSKLSADDICFNTYKYHYGSQPEDVFCSRIASGAAAENTTCLAHGSASCWKSSPYAISFIPSLGPPRWIFNGPVGLIPRKDRGQCNVNTNYFIAMIYNENDWIRRHMICSSDTFPCFNGTCIPLYQLCDGKIDCDAKGDFTDEDPTYCSATNRCSSIDRYYQCGFQGKCLNVTQIADGVVDCPYGSDEDPRLIFAFEQRVEKKNAADAFKCFPINIGEGVVADCSLDSKKVDCSDLVLGTEAILSCAKFYTPAQRAKFVKMTCYEDRKWKPFRQFSCEPECGLLANGSRLDLNVSGEPKRLNEAWFPWHGSIFKESARGVFGWICGASLIERNVLLTAAHCLFDATGERAPLDKFRIVLGSAIRDFTQIRNSPKAHIFLVSNTWSSYLFDLDTMQSDIAVIKLNKSIVYNKHIRPICYLPRNNKQQLFPLTGSTGYAEGCTAESVKQIAELEVASAEECDGGSFKFCAKLKSSVPELGSQLTLEGGGGIVFTTDEERTTSRFVLKGVLSGIQRSPKKLLNGEVMNNSASDFAFTHVDSYSEWLLNLLESIDTNPDAE